MCKTGSSVQGNATSVPCPFPFYREKLTDMERTRETSPIRSLARAVPDHRRAGNGAASHRASAGRLSVWAFILVLTLGLLEPGLVLAHCDPAAGHFDCGPAPAVTASDDAANRVPGPKDGLLANVTGRVRVVGANASRVRGELVNQLYTNQAVQRYLLLDVMVRLPYRAIGLRRKVDTTSVDLRVGYYRAGASAPYAICTLKPRLFTGRWVTYSVALKADASQTLMRWGRCDDPTIPGTDSLFPLAQAGDIARLQGPDNVLIAEFSPPVAVTPGNPRDERPKPRPATARLMEGGSYRVRK